MQLLDLFDLSLVGRRDVDALDYERADGTVDTLTFGELDARSNRVARPARAPRCRTGRPPRGLPPQPPRVHRPLPRLREARRDRRPDQRALPRARDRAHRRRRRAHGRRRDRRRAPRSSRGDACVGRRRAGAATRRRSRRAPCGARSTATRRRRSSTRRGRPDASKGAVLTHNNFAANARNAGRRAGTSPSADRYLAVLPLFHVHGLGNGLHRAGSSSGCRMRLVGALRAQRARRRCSTTSGRRSSSACRRSTCACSNVSGRDRARASAGACGCSSPARRRSPRARLRGVPRALRAHDPRALRHDRDADDHRQPVRRASAAPARSGFPLPGVSTRIVAADGSDVGGGRGGRTAGARPQRRSPATGAAPTPTPTAFVGRLVPHRRPRRAVAPTATSRCAGGAST